MNNLKTIIILIIVIIAGFLAYHYFTTGLLTGTKVFGINPANATYSVEGRIVTLTNGQATSDTTNPTSEDYFEASLGTVRGGGDVNSDLVPDTITTISYNSGGTGEFSYLTILPSGSNEPAPTLFIGDRIIIKAISFKEGIITVNYLDRGSAEPMVAEPTVAKVFKAKFINGQLIAVNNE